MIETESLILDKAKCSDWIEMYRNVWSQPESARYMEWTITTSEEAAKIRITKTIAFQKEHDTYLVYEKSSGKAIGFAGVEEIEPLIYQEAGICLGPGYVGKGFGAKEFVYSARDENTASNRLAESFGFSLISSAAKIDSQDGHQYNLLRYSLKL